MRPKKDYHIIIYIHVCSEEYYDASQSILYFIDDMYRIKELLSIIALNPRLAPEPI